MKNIPISDRPKGLFDVLELPLLGRLLRWRWGRLILQIPLLVAAAAVLIDGFIGPQSAARNLATVAPWVHYRGLVVIALLLVGNLFCMGCPFTITRTLGKKLALRGGRFPQILRNKWLAIASLMAMFFLYEWLDLWASPVLTAWVVVFYFVASFLLEAFFTESAFCKYVCPLGSFNFVYSTASPTQIAVKNQDVCRVCVGKECVNGSYAAESVIRIDSIPVAGSTDLIEKRVEHGPKGTLGCGTLLFAPQIKSNLDCTFCLDCVRACPHQNIGLMIRKPGRELLRADSWPKRWDVSLLVIFLTFMGLTNAFGMVPPVYELEQSLAEALNAQSEFPVLLLIFLAGNVAIPLSLTLLAAQLGRILTGIGRTQSLRDTVAAFAPAFVPLGFGVWIAHYGFHFLLAPLTIIPVIQEFLGQAGDWARFGTATDAGLIGLIQVIALVGGFAWSMSIAQQISLRLYRRQGLIGMIPWALLLLLVMLVALQIFSLPMEMRGTDFLSGG